MAKKQHSIKEIEDVILQSYTGDPNIESTFPVDAVKEGFIEIEGITYNYTVVRKIRYNSINNSYFYFEIAL